MYRAHLSQLHCFRGRMHGSFTVALFSHLLVLLSHLLISKHHRSSWNLNILGYQFNRVTILLGIYQ